MSSSTTISRLLLSLLCFNTGAAALRLWNDALDHGSLLAVLHLIIAFMLVGIAIFQLAAWLIAVAKGR